MIMNFCSDEGLNGRRLFEERSLSLKTSNLAIVKLN